jgi:hypothetical protein
MIWSTSLPSDFHRRLFIIIFVLVIIITFYIADSLNPLIILSLLSFVTYGAVWRKKEYYREKKGRILIESIQDPISLSYIACNTSNFLMGFFALDKIQEDWLRHKIQREAKSEEICTYASGIQVFKIPDAWYHYPPLNTVSCPNCLGIGHKTEFYTSAMNQSSNDYGAGDIKEINTVCSFCDGSGKIRV